MESSLSSLLQQLDAIADDRIRDLKACKAVLAALLRCVKAVTHAGGAAALSPSVPRIARRLCYFANARDTSVRGYSLRAARHLIVDEAAARVVCQEVRLLHVAT